MHGGGPTPTCRRSVVEPMGSEIGSDERKALIRRCNGNGKRSEIERLLRPTIALDVGGRKAE